MKLETKREYEKILKARYLLARTKNEKSLLIGEYIANTGVINRKSAIRALNRKQYKYRKKKSGPVEKYTYDLKVPLRVIWKMSNYACSKNLKPVIEEILNNLEKCKRIVVTQEQRKRLLDMSTFTIDRLLKWDRATRKGKGISGTTRSPHLKKLIPIRTCFDETTTVGDIEIDCVLHCGESVSGTYAETLNMVDIPTLWTEREIFLKKTYEKVVGALHRARNRNFPFPIKSIDFDNGFEFVNYKMYGYCESEGLKFTRSRSYKKNDQAHVEERNNHLVRGVIGYDRIESQSIVDLISNIYDNELRLLSNHFWPVRKLIYKEKTKGKYTKRYDEAQTPYRRVLESKGVDSEIKLRLIQEHVSLDVMALTCSLGEKLRRLKKMISVTDNNLATILEK